MQIETRLLYEEPSSDDLFVGGGHRRTAKELVRTVRQLRFRGGAIGLDGAWGSGKSTVVKMAAIELETSGPQLLHLNFLVFDLWSYQSDDFRQSLLRRLLDYAVHLLPECREFFEEKSIEISTKTQETEKNTDNNYALPAAYFILISPLLPLLISWLGPSYFSNSGQLPVLFGLQAHVVIGSLIGLGYLLFAAKFFIELRKNKKQPGFFGFIQWIKIAGSRSLSIFSKDPDKQNSITSIIEVDPSKNRFHSIFYEIISKLSEKRLEVVFVFDNIDRLPEKSVVESLAGLRLIFGRDDAAMCGAVPPIYVLPFDRNHLSKALSLSDAKNDLLDKMFDRTLRVSLPVVTDWHGYLASCLERAFSSALDDRTVYRISRMFDMRLHETGESPTPRRIIAFTNDLASLWSQWQEGIPVLSVALYLLYRTDLIATTDVVEAIEGISTNASAVTDDEDWFKNVAALHYNVPPEHAYQVLLMPRINRALSEKDDRLEQYEMVPGFGQVLVRCVAIYATTWAEVDVPRLLAAVEKVSRLSTDTPFVREVLNALATSFQLLSTSTQLPTRQHIDNVVALLSMPLDESKAEAGAAFLTWLSKMLVQHEKDGRSGGELWVYALSEISHVSANLPKARTQFNREPPAPSRQDFAIGLASGCIQHGIRYSELNVSIPSSALAEELTSYIAQKGDSANDLFHELYSANFSPHIAEVADSLVRLITKAAAEGTSIPSQSIVLLAEAISSAGTAADKLSTALSQFINDGALRSIAYAAENLSSDAQAAVAWLTLRCCKSLRPQIPQTHPQYGDLTASAQWFEQILQSQLEEPSIRLLSTWTERSETVSEWIAAAASARGLLVDTLLRTVIDREIFNKLNISTIILNYEIVSEILGDDASAKFIRYFTKWSAFYDRVDDSIGLIPVSFVEDASHSGLSAYNPIMRKVDLNLAATDAATWDAEISSFGSLLRKAIVRKRAAAVYLPAEPFRTCLMEHARSVLMGNQSTDPDLGDWAEITNLLQPRSRIKLGEDLYKALARIKPTTAGWDGFMICYASLLLSMPLSANSDRTLDRVLIPLLQSNMPESVTAISKLIDPLTNAVRHAGRPAISRLEKLLRQNKKSENSPHRTTARSLLRIINERN